MNYKIDFEYNNINKNEKLFNKIQEVVNLCLDETKKQHKVSFYYEDINSNTVITYYPSVCFYAASVIKVLVALIIYRKALSNEIDLDEGLKELIRLCIVESDNEAYIKLVDLVGKDAIKEYGNKLGAIHTMEGVDSYGITNANDLKCYFSEIKRFIDENNKYSEEFKNYLLNPSYKIVKDNTKPFIRKYGEYGIAYHEVGYVLDDSPYFMFILTQLNEFDYKDEFINNIYKKVEELHEIVKETLCQK